MTSNWPLGQHDLRPVRNRQLFRTMCDLVRCCIGTFKDVRFYTILNFGLFWAPFIFSMFLPHNEFWPFLAPPLFKISVFYPTRFFRQFLADPTFSAVRSTFLAEDEAQNLEILHHPKFWPFLGRPLKDVLEFFQIFGLAPSPHTVSISCVFLCVLLLCSLAIFSLSQRCVGCLSV